MGGWMSGVAAHRSHTYSPVEGSRPDRRNLSDGASYGRVDDSMSRDPTAATLFQEASVLFNRARRLPRDQRSAFLDEACRDGSTLRRHVDALLREHEHIASHAPETKKKDPNTLSRLIQASMGVREGSSRTPDRVGPYRIIRRIGIGGMGEVYEAEQAEPTRRVAVKVLRAEVATPETRARFRRESELPARLQHDDIAKVYAVGEEGRDLYLAMEFIEGKPLDVIVARLSMRDRIRIMIRVCAAVACAHRNGIIHRDLKPSNILATHGGGLKILDFGAARPVEGTQHTAEGHLLGTLAYMSPEQLTAGSDHVDTQSDVYSLGVLCFEAFSGRRPFESKESIPAGSCVRSWRPSHPRYTRSIERSLATCASSLPKCWSETPFVGTRRPTHCAKTSRATWTISRSSRARPLASISSRNSLRVIRLS